MNKWLATLVLPDLRKLLERWNAENIKKEKLNLV